MLLIVVINCVYFVCVCVCGHVHATVYVYVGQRTAIESWFSSGMVSCSQPFHWLGYS